MIVVDASPLIYLSKVRKLRLLKQLYGTLIIPRGVWNEVVPQPEGRPGGSELETGRKQGWIKVEEVRVPQTIQNEGATGADGEAIALAMNRHLPLLTNDRALVTMAKMHEVSAKWLTESVIECVNRRILSPGEARDLLRELISAGLRVRSEVLAEIIHLIEEPRRPSRA